MRTNILETEQFGDTDGLSKKLQKLSQRKDCEVLKKWFRSIKKHIYWSAISSVSGPEKVAKWTSLINHIQNVHVHENTLFPKCEHPDKASSDPKKWFQPDYVDDLINLLINEVFLDPH
ncbi:hypothetical protein DPX16_0835 [Anabarilius grahami]|uniref:Uncharacterized protein n=1 Tax=Anabarilius grahami TaxID=495550 RepID=A0A3N0XLR2_ANAGA|nr:hypothetical protein DPX16_0835 [Anabarilius grahami]